MPLNPIGELHYNGVDFDASTKVEVQTAYQNDAANRTTMQRVITLRAESYFFSLDDNQLQAIEIALGRKGGALRYRAEGFDLSVNAGGIGGSVDIAFGPTPQVLDWKNMGDGTIRVEWQCIIVLPNCLSGSLANIKEFVYQVTWSHPYQGYRSRTITGHYSIPASRFVDGAPTRRIPVSASAYREEVLAIFDRPLNWKRSQEFTLSIDHATESFTIRDEEIASEQPYPAHVVDIDGHHRIGWNLRNAGFAANRISASITMAPGFGSGAALAVFRAVCNSRLRPALAIAKSMGGCVLIESIDADENLFGKPHSFSITYRISGGVDKAPKPSSQEGEPDKVKEYMMLGGKFLELSGFGSPISGMNWNAWMQSMYGLDETGPFSLRGSKGTETRRLPDDVIIDLCYQDAQFRRPPTGAGAPPTVSPGSSAFVAEIPREEASWLRYWHKWEEQTSAYDLATIKALAKTELPKAKKESDEAVVDRYNSPVTYDDQKLTRLLRNGDGQTWVLTGFGERVAYKLGRLPASVKLADQKATLLLIDGRIRRQVRASPLGVKVHYGSFAAIYVANKKLSNPPPDMCFP